MAISDYFYNQPEFISVQYQEFYCRGIFAEACYVWLPPGFGGNLTILSPPLAADEQGTTFTVEDDSGNVFPPTEGYAFLGDYLTDFNVTRGGVTRSAYQEQRVTLPTIGPGGGINGQWNVHSWNTQANPGFLGSTPPQWYTDSFQTAYNTLATAHDVFRLVGAPVSPGHESDFILVPGDNFVEGNGIFLARVNLTLPDDYKAGGGALPRLYNAGYLAFGHSA